MPPAVHLSCLKFAFARKYCMRLGELPRLRLHTLAESRLPACSTSLKASIRPVSQPLLSSQFHHALNGRTLTQHTIYSAAALADRISFPKRRLPKTRRAALPKTKVGHLDGVSLPSRNAKARRLASVEELEQELSLIAHEKPWKPAIQNILHILIKDRRIRPTALHFEASILSNCEGQLGSVDAVDAALQEMERADMAIGTSVIAAALKALAIHPDYLLRSSILARTLEQWVPISPSINEHIILGLLRDGQLELAYQQIQDYQTAHKGSIPLYVFSLLIYKLCEASDFDAVLRTLYYMYDERLDLRLGPYMWYHILDTASAHLHLECTKYVWRHMVEPFYINPSTGICYNILLAAARVGDVYLTESVGQLLACREEGTPGMTSLVLRKEAYRNAGDVRAVKRIRNLIRKPKIEDQTVQQEEVTSSTS